MCTMGYHLKYISYYVLKLKRILKRNLLYFLLNRVNKFFSGEMQSTHTGILFQDIVIWFVSPRWMGFKNSKASMLGNDRDFEQI